MKKNKTIYFVVAILCLCIMVVSVFASYYTVYINGKQISDYIVKDNKVYISVDELQKAGANVTKSSNSISVQFVPTGGRYQLEGVEGVEGEWVSNNALRIRVSAPQKTVNPFYGRGEGYSVRIEVANLLPNPVSPHGVGLNDILIYDDQGNVLNFSQGSFSNLFKPIPPGATVTDEVKFGIRSLQKTPGKPVKILFIFGNVGGKTYSNIRINFK
ncbi:MAG: hypothetical protein ABDH21_04120 [bacterium]